jgi:dipeptidyl aminopeptidase/acylaminoacyl peptidase
MSLLIRLLACGLLLCAGAAPAVPTEAFARLPQLEHVALSPDGTRFAAIMNRGDDTVAVVRRIDGDEPLKAVLRNDNRESRLAWVRWVNDERLIISVHYPARRGGTDTEEGRLLAINRDGTKPVTLVEPSGYEFGSLTQVQDRVIDWLPEDGHHILMLAAVDRRSIYPAVIKVDIDSGAREPVHGRNFGVLQWMTDATHRVRVGIWRSGTKVEVRVCDPDGERWRTLWAYETFDRAAVEPLGFGTDPQLLYVVAEHEGRRAVFEVDLRDAALARRLVRADPLRDVGGPLLREPKTGRVVGAGGGSAASFWDPTMKALAGAVDAALPGRTSRFVDFSADGQRYLVYASGNGQPGQFMVGRRDRGELSLVGKLYPELTAEVMVRKEPFTITARDGLKLPAFLTLPAGAKAEKLPTVLLPHGGPISQDTLDFDPLAEFLAHRGYAVLQVNYRGSAGQGYDFVQAGLKRWGLEMQDDLSDALQWLVQRGTADPARVCIVGGSYGGYAALMGGAKTPELYRCVLSVNGVTDLPDMATFRGKFVNGYDFFARQVGSTFSDREQLEATSPTRLAAQFRAPVLLLHGTLDRTVPYAQSEKMAAALKAAGKDVRFVELTDGDHSLNVGSLRLRFYRELEDFLAANLGSR